MRDRGDSNSRRPATPSVLLSLAIAVAVATFHALAPGTGDGRWTFVAAILTFVCSRLDLRRLAVVAGAVQPVEVLDGVPARTLLVLRLIPVALLAVGWLAERWARADDGPSEGGLPILVRWLGTLLVASVAVRAAFAVDRTGLTSSAKFLVVSTFLVVVVVVGVGHRRLAWSVAVGHLIGATFSGVVALLQAAGWWSPRELLFENNRYPGLSIEAPQLSWQLASAFVIAVAVALGGGTDRRGRWPAAVAGVVCLTGLVSCGAQGGLVALVAAGVVVGVVAWRHHELGRPTAGQVGIAVAALLVGLAVLQVSGVGLGSLSGLFGDQDRGYVNEVARLDGFRDGFRSFLDHPWTGVGVEAYNERFDVPPHVYPLFVAVSAGVLGLLIGVGAMGVVALGTWSALVAWPPSRRERGYAWAAMGLLFLAEAMLTPTGAFEQPSRTVLLLAMVAAVSLRGEHGDRRPDPDATTVPIPEHER